MHRKCLYFYVNWQVLTPSQIGRCCFALMVCTESNPVVLSRAGETRLHRCIVLVCIRKKTWTLDDQKLVGFYRVSYDANQGQIWNSRQFQEEIKSSDSSENKSLSSSLSKTLEISNSVRKHVFRFILRATIFLAMERAVQSVSKNCRRRRPRGTRVGGAPQREKCKLLDSAMQSVVYSQLCVVEMQVSWAEWFAVVLSRNQLREIVMY